MRQEDQEEAAVAAVFDNVGPRTQPPDSIRDAVYRSARAAWQDQVARRRRRRMWQYALAASVVLGMVGTGVLVDRAVTSRHVLIEAALKPPADAVLEDGGPDGRRLAAPGGEMLRLQPGSRIATRGNELWLLKGAVYVESAGTEGAGALVVNAEGVQVRHIGTRFAVAVNDGGVEVLVRDGMVEVLSGAERERAMGGTTLSLTTGSRRLQRGNVETWGPPWNWADDLAPPLAIDGMLIATVLQEIAFQTGHQLEFDNEEVRRTCETFRLKGPILDLPASRWLRAVLLITDFDADVNGQRIVIRRRAE